MDYDYGSARQLSSGALQILNKYEISENKRNIYVNFILQIYKCVPLLPSDYFSCSLFDKENICNKFILKYDQADGKPYIGDIILVTKINVSILSNRENKLFICEEIKLLEKGKKFLINPKNLINISSKLKIDNKNQNNNNIPLNSKKERKVEFQKLPKQEEKFLEISSKNSSKKEISNIGNSPISVSYSSYTNDKINSDSNININIENNKKENESNKNKEALKIYSIKEESLSQKEKDMIMDSINLFLDDFQDGIEEEPKKSKKIEKIEKKEELKDYSLLQKRNIKPPKIIKQKKPEKEIDNIQYNIQYKYISEINKIIFAFQNMNLNSIYKIKCHIEEFDIDKKIFYMGCSLCKKIIKNKDKLCCMGSTEIPLYNFHITVKDPTGKCKVYFNDEQGNKLMGYSAEKFRNLLNDNTTIGKIIFDEYKSDLFENEFMIYIKFSDDFKGRNKKIKAVNIERIGKKHRYDIVNELKNILV